MDVKWIKLNVGMFDGNSFKKIKKAKIAGESFRDKLTAVWFELLDFAGKCNAGGQLIESPEIPFASIDDIAILIDREPEELQLCMQFFITNRMISVIDDVYMLTNWAKYQNEDGLERIREQNRIRQKKWYDKQKLLPNTDLTLGITLPNATEEDIDIDIEEEHKKKDNTQTLFEKLLPDYILSEAVVKKVSEWLKYKSERRESYKEQGMKALLRKIENNTIHFGDKAVCELIDECMASNWKGIIFDKLKHKAETNPSTASYDLDEFQERSLHGELKYRRKN